MLRLAVTNSKAEIGSVSIIKRSCRSISRYKCRPAVGGAHSQTQWRESIISRQNRSVLPNVEGRGQAFKLAFVTQFDVVSLAEFCLQTGAENSRFLISIQIFDVIIISRPSDSLQKWQRAVIHKRSIFCS